MTTTLPWLLIAGFLLAAAVTLWERGFRTKGARRRLTSGRDFDLFYVSPKDQSAIGLDAKTGQLLLAEDGEPALFDLARLSAAEVVVNGVIVSRITRASGREEIVRQAGDPAMLPDRLTDLTLRVSVESADHDAWSISYLRHTKYFREMEGVRTLGLPSRGREARKAMAEIRKAYGRLSEALRRAPSPPHTS